MLQAMAGSERSGAEMEDSTVPSSVTSLETPTESDSDEARATKPNVAAETDAVGRRNAPPSELKTAPSSELRTNQVHLPKPPASKATAPSPPPRAKNPPVRTAVGPSAVRPAPPLTAPSAAIAAPSTPSPNPPPAVASGSSSSRRQAVPLAEPRSGFAFQRARTYAFALDDAGQPILLGSGRFARLYLGYERWEESVTRHRPVVIKLLQRDLEDGEITRFGQEKALLEYLQGHPSIVEMLASGKIAEDSLPDSVRMSCEGDFLILEKLDMTLMERLKGTRDPQMKEDLAALGVRERLVRVLEYVIPVASAIEFAHLVRNVCHRDISPSNVLLGLPDPKLAGSTMHVRLADFSAARMDREEGVTRIGAGVPGTTYFQSPEQETNLLGLLVNVKNGSRDVEYFEDFYVHIAKQDTFALVNRAHEYVIREVDRPKKRFVLDTPYAEETEEHVRGNVQKRVGRPADIYAIGALLYYLMSGACRNPKALNDTFRKFDEYQSLGSDSAIEDYLKSEYEALQAARGKTQRGPREGFRYQHFVDANEEPIPFDVMRIIARCMIRNKPDSYCTSNDLETTVITEVVRDLVGLHSRFGLMPAVTTPGIHRHAVVPYGKGARAVVARVYEALVALLGKSER
jgi:serine/threonine protein kinase